MVDPGAPSAPDAPDALGAPEDFAADLRRRLPPADARLRAAVRGPVEILRDRAGVPHVYAGSTADLYFGLGFATAQDRLWQLDRLRRRALGRQAEVLGPEYVRSDLVHRTVGIEAIARAEAERLDERTHEIVSAYVAGINRQLEQASASPGALPIEFDLLGYACQPFGVADVLAILRGQWWSLNGRLEGLVAAEAAGLLPEGPLRALYLTPEAPETRIVPPGSPTPPPDLLAGSGDATGSNNWAVAPERTVAGRAILCSDPHQPFWLPGSWYEYALEGPEESAAGAGHPGVPGLWWGSNGAIAWGVTNNAASTRDLYVETAHPDDPDRYRAGDVWRPFERREVTIAVRGEAPRAYTLRATVRGPVMNDVLPPLREGGDPPLSLRWVGQEHLDDVRALVAIGRARDGEGFRAALRDWSVPVFNFVFASGAGEIGYQCAGRVPLRGRIVPGFREAGRPEDAWRGYLPADALPRLESPGRGYVASANNRPVPDDYPYPLYGAWAAGHRAARLAQVLDGAPEGATGRRFSRDDLIALQNDVTSARAARLVPALVRRLREGSAGDDRDVALLGDTLAAWDHRYTLESPAPVLFETFSRLWQRRVARERFPERLLPLVQGQGGAAARLLEADDPGWFPDGTALARALADTAREAVAEVRRRWGDDPAGWRWGRIHLAHWRHPLSDGATAPHFDLGPAPVDGCADTVRNTGRSPTCGADSGAEYRLVVDFAQPDRFLAVQCTGNSGQPGSPHYGDGFAPWIAGEYHVVHLRRTAVEADLEGRTIVEPLDPARPA
jgi:penicillin amidase